MFVFVLSYAHLLLLYIYSYFLSFLCRCPDDEVRLASKHVENKVNNVHPSAGSFLSYSPTLTKELIY